jgi:predicted kinase
VQIDGRPTLFDPVEFNDAISCIDVMYDLAFLLMDLERLDLRAHANTILNAYLRITHDVGGLAALPLFLSCRAAVRAKTSAASAGVQVDPAARRQEAAAAAEFLDLADRLIHPTPPRLVAIGGLSGSGKSSLARGLAPFVGPRPGAVVARSDEIRKEIHGVDASVPLPASAYTAVQSERVYKELCERASSVLTHAHAAVADAVFQREQDRWQIEEIAHRSGVPFVGLWLNAPDSMLADRIAGREMDASDADETVLRRQQAEGHGPMSWHVIDAAQPLERVLEDANAIVQAAGRR